MAVSNHLDQAMLRGLFTPIDDEIDVDHLEVTGTIPSNLDGRFVRNGPNPKFEPRGRYHMFDGDGMLHSVTIADGSAQYRNRWIRTAALGAEERAGRALYGGLGEMYFPTPDEVGDAGPRKNPANTNLVRHAGRYWALYEAGLPTEVTADLETIGVDDFDGRLVGSFTAHPRVDPRTGEMFAFQYSAFAPHLRVYAFDADGALVRTDDVDMPACSVMHDFVITERSLVFVDAPLLFDLAGAMRGEAPFNWAPDHGTRVGVLPRSGGAISWFEIPDGYFNHFWNAWEDDGRIVLSGSCSPGDAYTNSGQGGEGTADASPGLPTRVVVDLVRGTATSEQIDDLGGDYPRINERLTGTRSRFHTMGAFAGTPDIIGHFDTVVQYDDHTGARTTWCAGPGSVVGEAVFAAATDGQGENEGWLLCTVHDRATGATDVAVLDATDVATGPVARIHMPQRLPFGFHAAWFGNDITH